MITAKEFLEKLMSNKKLIFLFVAGLFIVLFSGLFNGSKESTLPEKEQNEMQYIDEKGLEEILANVEGAGKVQVYITYKDTGEKIVAYDSDKDEKTVVNSGKNNEPYVLTVRHPEIKGVLVIATGAGNENVKNRLLKCVKSITDIPYSNICVEIRKM